MNRFPKLLPAILLAVIQIAWGGSLCASLMLVDAEDFQGASVSAMNSEPVEEPNDHPQLFDWDLSQPGIAQVTTNGLGTGFGSCIHESIQIFSIDIRPSDLFVTDFQFVPPAFVRGLFRPPRNSKLS